MGAVSILRGISPCYESTGVGSLASVEQPIFVASSLPSGTVLYSGATTYLGTDSACAPQYSTIIAGGSSYVDHTGSNSMIGLVRRSAGQVLVDIYEGRLGQSGAGRPGRPSPQPFTTDQGLSIYPNYLGTATVRESDMISAGSMCYHNFYPYIVKGFDGSNRPIKPDGSIGNGIWASGGSRGTPIWYIEWTEQYFTTSFTYVFPGLYYSGYAAFGTADPAQFGSTILEESRAAATAYPSGSMSSSASGNRITCRMN